MSPVIFASKPLSQLLTVSTNVGKGMVSQDSLTDSKIREKPKALPMAFPAKVRLPVLRNALWSRRERWG